MYSKRTSYTVGNCLQATSSCYRAHCSRFKQKVACLEPLESCRPVYKRFPIPVSLPYLFFYSLSSYWLLQNVHGEHDPYIGCVNDPLPRHYRGTVLGHSVLNLQFLEDLFNEGVIPPTEECNVIEPLKTQRGYCGKHLETVIQVLMEELLTV